MALYIKPHTCACGYDSAAAVEKLGGMKVINIIIVAPLVPRRAL